MGTELQPIEGIGRQVNWKLEHTAVRAIPGMPPTDQIPADRNMRFTLSRGHGPDASGDVLLATFPCAATRVDAVIYFRKQRPSQVAPGASNDIRNFQKEALHTVPQPL